jgi:DNA-directed RNA polymerase specialized sigma24 family protein
VAAANERRMRLQQAGVMQLSDNPESVSEWLERLKAGDQGLPVQRLWDRYFHRLVRLAQESLKTVPRRVADEEDVALSAFKSLCQAASCGKFPRLNDRYDLWRLLVTITAYKAYQLKTSNSRQKRGGDRVFDEARLANEGNKRTGITRLEQFLASEPTAELVAMAADEYEHLIASLANDGLRSVARLKMEGFSNNEIATRLGCAPRTIERRLLSIRTIWQTYLDPELEL